MNAANANIVAFPARAENLQLSARSEWRTVIIVSDGDRDETIIRYILDDTGQPRTEIVASSINAVCEVFEKEQGDIVLIRDSTFGCEPRRLLEVLNRLPQHAPTLIISEEAHEESIGRYVTTGARDVISLEHPRHLRSVVSRECGVVKLYRALERAQNLTENYKKQVRHLTQSSTQAIADVRDGSIVGANTAWSELFHCSDRRQLLNTPVLDMIGKSHRPMVKRLMSERQTSKRRGPGIKVLGEGVDGAEIPVSINLERIRVEGKVTIRFTASPDTAAVSELVPTLDPSTQFYNRAFFIDQFQKQLAQPLSGGVRALAYIRLDQFSSVLGSVGVMESERVIEHFAGVLRELVHPSDLYGRFGGTVFAILIKRGTMRDIEAWARHLNSEITESPFDHEGNEIKLSCTIGICEIIDPHMTVDTIMREAHEACQHGRLKCSGEVHLSVSSQRSQKNSRNAAKKIKRIQLALRNNRFRLARTPVIRIDNTYCKIRDAWVRMIDEDGGDILPREFMPIAERHNLMPMIDRWVIAASITYCAKRQPDTIFVRLSQDSVLDESLPKWVDSVIKDSQATHAQLCFQTTEETAAKFLKQTIRQAKTLKELGFNFAIDQLGTTSQTMKIIEYLPMQYARIDGSLLQGVARDKSIQARVSELVNAAKAHGIRTIGERIEDASTMAAACKIGIEYAQGDFIQHEDIVLEDTHTICKPILPAVSAV